MRNQAQKSFTIIEVVIAVTVLGILAGIIIALVSGSDNSEKDIKRKSDITKISEAILSYQSTDGALPSTSGIWCDLRQDGNGCAGFPAVLEPNYIDSIPRESSDSYYKYYSDGKIFFLKSSLSNYTFSSIGKVFSSTKNLFTLNQSNGGENGNTLGFYSNGADISSESNIIFHGTKSIKVVTKNFNSYEGVYLDTIYTKPDSDYTYSVYLRGEGIVYVGLENKDSKGNTMSYPTIEFTLTDSWQRYVIPFKTHINSIRVVPIVYTANAEAVTFYVDAAQFETGSNATSWTPGD